MLILTFFDKCGDNDAFVATFVAKIFLMLDNAGIEHFTDLSKLNMVVWWFALILGFSQFWKLPQPPQRWSYNY